MKVAQLIILAYAQQIQEIPIIRFQILVIIIALIQFIQIMFIHILMLVFLE